MPGPMSAPNGNGHLTLNGDERRKALQSGKLRTGKSAGDSWRLAEILGRKSGG
ncbi:hypothetical protein PBI_MALAGASYROSE_1 [Mycobacterium phage MalagasyRose]|uniref:Uncharacterized protein n=1 Tax=Mycobacterium phage MalagasyRose TaxID=2599870 RepID=A0A5J6TD49_9CAUD|nr:hypothetical protein QEH39_gp01 [Mycobacterium phage MalagasyRose]QFG08853.1 hypothetical protein PBI_MALAGASYROSE_1 [Mycobacterium phage MalagasyRose]